MTPAVRDRWGSHWTGHQSQHDPDQRDENGLPDIWSHYHPLIGLYDSTDPDVLECHLLQMKLAGINGVIVDWYGIGDAADYPPVHAATKAMFTATGRLNMKFAACYEDRSIELMVNWDKLKPEEAGDELRRTLRWMQENWFSKGHYLQLNGRPLLLNFGPIYIHDGDIWDKALADLPTRPAFFALHHLWRQVRADGGFTWIHHDPWEGTPSAARIRERIKEVFTYFTHNPAKAIVSAYPGYNDVYENGSRVLAHRDGKTLQETLEVGLAGDWPLIQLVTWNDYGEGTMIEPTHEFGYTFLEVIQQARRQELGDAFPFTPADLRLPARLYALRQAGNAPTETLAEISQLLKQGRCREARFKIEQCETGKIRKTQFWEVWK
jgi:hypothetical protein